MADHNSSQSGDEHHEEHHGGLGLFVKVFIGLCILTLISFFVANSPIMEAKGVGWAIMMAVSVMKALLVVSFFMHLLWEANWKWVLTIPASLMSVFLVLMLTPDVGQRTRRYSSERWLHAASPQLDEHAAEHPDGSSEEEAKKPTEGDAHQE